MAASRLTHELLCIGAHATAENPFPAANATALYHLFTGGLGPSRIAAECLVGQRATTDAVAHSFDAAVVRRATNFILYFAGRASSSGIHVADGAVDGQTLAGHFARVPARSVLVLFDVVIGAEPDQALAPKWARALVQSRSGVRFAAARATRIGAGAEGTGLSRFTSAFVHALETSPGGVKFEAVPYISDRAALQATQSILGARWGVTHQPIELGTFGDIPLVKSQANRALGSAKIENVVVGAGLSLAVAHTIEGRSRVPTYLHWSLETPSGALLGEASREIVPERAIETDRSRVRLPPKLLRKLSSADPGLRDATTVSLCWRVSLRDAQDRALDEKILDQTYARPIARARGR